MQLRFVVVFAREAVPADMVKSAGAFSAVFKSSTTPLELQATTGKTSLFHEKVKGRNLVIEEPVCRMPTGEKTGGFPQILDSPVHKPIISDFPLAAKRDMIRGKCAKTCTFGYRLYDFS
jgi:hypothetical protein